MDSWILHLTRSYGSYFLEIFWNLKFLLKKSTNSCSQLQCLVQNVILFYKIGTIKNHYVNGRHFQTWPNVMARGRVMSNSTSLFISKCLRSPNVLRRTYFFGWRNLDLVVVLLMVWEVECYTICEPLLDFF